MHIQQNAVVTNLRTVIADLAVIRQHTGLFYSLSVRKKHGVITQSMISLRKIN